MKHIIIGTAGHIDHGKTTLIKALTGRNTDRWEEEQRRGITIDLGFTWFDLKNGNRAGIIDVPGHEKFINNMVAGVVGMDLVLLVIAADEGIMPQTREHMDILEMLGVQKSILVLNKCDLVDEEWLEMVEEEIREELQGTFLEQAPVVKVSAATGAGIPLLVETIERLSEDEVVEKEIHTIPRLPVDRVFSLSGFGTVVTGTLVSGTISKEDKLEMFPNGRECKIRNIQVHGRDVETCYAGQRVAINISNMKKKELQRGCVLAPPGSMKDSRLLDVKLEMLDSSVRVLANNTRLHFFSGTSEVLCRAVLLGDETLGPGESGYVQLRMEKEVAFRRGDRFVVRFYSPMETIGGGVILEPNAVKKKRFSPEVLDSLKQKESGSAEDVIELHVKEYAETMAAMSELAKLTALSREETEEAVKILAEEGLVCVFPMKKDTFVWHTADERAYREKILNALKKYVEKNPYRYGMAKAEVHSTYMKRVKPNIFDKYIEYLEAQNILSRHDEFLAPPAYEAARDAVYEKVRRTLLGVLKPAGYDFARMTDISFGEIPAGTVEDILLLLVDSGEIVKVADGMYTLGSYMDAAREKIVEKLKADGKITIAEIRDMFGTSRKSAKPILEYMDSIKVTRKTGAESERISNL
ncbi:selenocysteine-specific translation elongation factor [Eubacterium sp. am_0171]|uniref:selenocysteine-specific translation elongation factor n=1 Tax=unclassified Eubacterium (in: firmicutes) TaxID=2624479 RepID=UPI001021BC7A|nr:MULTISPECIES: selenocysteine-specific translation elongation factor [unclassified Eubacterium (in: firmicutes)]MSC83587.1 selenocysteine-specific translation elongation factor [Eubacterium sp. BIOML-A1]MSD05981.1 selenocysteine-specific translation elongation factor [Eubacterium sp. BIOML-A2]RYT22591.1 selenocysteine-specific translation elongation factor [Eubacterium sp. am_0171]